MLKVINDNVLVKVTRDADKTESGILLANVNEERKYEGVVVDVGDNKDIAESGIEVGTYVFYQKGLNIEVIENDVIYDVVNIYDIIAKGVE